MLGNSEKPKVIFRYLYEKLTMGRELYLFLDLSFGIALNLMLNRHHLLPTLTLLIPGFLDPCSTGGGHKVPPSVKSPILQI